MTHPSKQVEIINQILNVVDDMKPKGTSLINFDALHAIRHVLERTNEWEGLGNSTLLKRKLKKNSVTVN